MPSFGKFYFSIRKPFFISAVPVLSASFLAIFFLLRGQMLLMPSIDYLLQFIRSKPSPVWARAWVWVKPLSSSQWLPFFHMVSCYQCHLLTTCCNLLDQNLPQSEPEPGCGWNLYPLRSGCLSSTWSAVISAIYWLLLALFQIKTFPSLSRSLGVGETFLLFAAVAFLCLLWGVSTVNLHSNTITTGT